VTRGHLAEQEEKLAGSGIDFGLCNPKYVRVHKKVAKDLIFSPMQKSKRTYYFCGDQY